jgi:sarcosine oxidase
MRRDFDAIVLGLGGIGSGALYWLSRQFGDRVLGIEQFAPRHDRGGSQDHSRIIRYSYHRPVYVRLAALAYAAWDEVEAETGEALVHRCGGLDLFPPGGFIPSDDYTESLDACGIPYELLDAAEIRRRWPPFTVGDGVRGLYPADGGLVAAARANAAHLDAARRRGAVVRAEAPVTAVRAEGGEVEVDAGGETVRTAALVIAAGAWTNAVLVHFGLELPLTVTREQVTYFAAPDLAPFDPGRFPVWIWQDDPSFYGFPAFGEAAVKIGQDVGGHETTAEGRDFEPDPAALARVRGFCRDVLPGALGPELTTKTCLYTLPPDRDFVAGAVPGHPGCVLAVGAGHAFKFASVLGRLLGDLAVDGVADFDLAPFRADRPILLEKEPVKSFLV